MMSESPFAIICKICRQLYVLAEEEGEGNLPHLLQCGHVYCASCLNLLKSPSNTIACPDCKLETSVYEDGVDGLQVDSKTIGLIYTAKIKKSREQRQKASPEKRLPATESAPKEKNVTLEALDHALIEAVKHQSQLQSIYESLVEGLQSQVSTEKERLVTEISEMTEKAIGVLQKRKVTLVSGLCELDHWFSESRRVLREVEQKKKHLENVILQAQNLNLPNGQGDFNIEQVLEALRVPLDIQAFDLSCLTQGTGLGCTLDSEKLEQCLSISQVNIACTSKDCVASCSRRSSVSSGESRSASRPKTPSPPPASDWVAEYQGLRHAQASSSPNVIIEEIIEDSPAVSPQPISAPQSKPQESQKKRKGGQVSSLPVHEEKACLFWVVVTHVVSPAHFYVRYVSEQRAGVHLSKKINSLCMGTKSMFSSDHVIKKGDLLFVRWKAGVWFRAQVVELYRARGGEAVKQCLALEIVRLKVFFLDYGFIRGLTVTSGEALVGLNECLRRPDRSAQAEMSRWPPQAIRCCLNDIVPAQLTGWSSESSREIRNVTGSSAVRMQVFGDDRGTLLVDLKKAPMDHTNSRMPISLRDHLVFMELARFYCPVSATAASCKPLQYYPPILPKSKIEFYAIISHINTPSDFFIQLTENMEFPLLASKLQACYGVGPDKASLQLSCPMLEQACVALYDENVWYRARIIGFHGMRMAEVQFVDVGSTRVVAVSDLRIIRDEFLSLPAMAVWCYLADVECDGYYWSDHSIQRFRNMADKKLVTVVIKKFRSSYGPLPVCLFEADDKMQSSSIAHILITEGLAKSPKSSPPMTPEVSVWDPPLESMETDPTATEVSDCIRLSPVHTIPASQKDIKVRVTHITSPTNIYVQLLQHDQKLKRLQERLQREFGKTVQLSVDWEPGMACAALINGVWERGQVSGVVSSSMLEVLRCDYGNSVKVPVDNLRPLPPQMVGSFLLECRLSGIRPAGGPKWTATSCDLISFYLTGATALMTIKEPPPVHPIGVSLFCSNRAGQNVNMADFLISEGLALPERKTREVNCREILEPYLVEALPALEVTHDESVALPEEVITQVDDHASEVPPSTGTYPPPEPPTQPGNTRLSITAVRDDGVIYGMTSQAESDLERLQKRLQQHIKATPVLTCQNWRGVNGCIIKGTDMLWHRGQVVELTGGQVKVQYVDLGLVEAIPACHVYPMVVCEDVPQLCLPMRLHRGKPVGKDWHLDAVALMREVLLGRSVNVQIMELPTEPQECVPVEILLDGMPMSRIMAHHHPSCINLSAMDFEEQVLSPVADLDDWKLDTKGLLDHPPLLGAFADPALPKAGKQLPVKIKHLCTPNKVYLNFSQEEEGEVSLEEVLECVNADVKSLSCLTDFPIEGPCLAEYNDGNFYRAELTGFVSVSPEIKMLVRHVDFGSDDTVPIHKLRCLPECLLDFPRKAVCVRLGGFQPPRVCSETKRLPYAPEWSVKALLEMMNLLQKKGVYRAFLTTVGEETVAYLYSPEEALVHHALVKRGLAEYERISAHLRTYVRSLTQS